MENIYSRSVGQTIPSRIANRGVFSSIYCSRDSEPGRNRIFCLRGVVFKVVHNCSVEGGVGKGDEAAVSEICAFSIQSVERLSGTNTGYFTEANPVVAGSA